jgi:hypothetical protein
MGRSRQGLEIVELLLEGCQRGYLTPLVSLLFLPFALELFLLLRERFF